MKLCVWLFYMAVNLLIFGMYLVHPYGKTSSYATVQGSDTDLEKGMTIVDLLLQFITGMHKCRGRSTMCVCVCVCHATPPLSILLPSKLQFYCLCVFMCVCVMPPDPLFLCSFPSPSAHYR